MHSTIRQLIWQIEERISNLKLLRHQLLQFQGAEEKITKLEEDLRIAESERHTLIKKL